MRRWVTINGNKVLIDGGCTYHNNYHKHWTDISDLRKSCFCRVSCFFCGSGVYFVRAARGGCFLADSPPPNEWIMHSCWLNRDERKYSDSYIIEHYKNIGVNPITEYSLKFGPTNAESKYDVFIGRAKKEVDIFMVHSIYKNDFLIDGESFKIVRLFRDDLPVSALVRSCHVLSRLIIKREEYKLGLSSMEYGDSYLLYVSEISLEEKIEDKVEECQMFETVVTAKRAAIG